MTVWTRLPIVARHETADPVRTVAVTLAGSDGPVCVFGTVLPWLNDKGPDAANPAPGWAEFAGVTRLQGAEWRRPRALDSAAAPVVAGDLNQNLGGAHYYGTVAGRALLRGELASAGLECLTQAEHFAPGELDYPPIDHVCAGAPVGRRLEYTVTGWNKTHPDGTVLSDHSGVLAEISLSAAT